MEVLIDLNFPYVYFCVCMLVSKVTENLFTMKPSFITQMESLLQWIPVAYESVLSYQFT